MTASPSFDPRLTPARADLAAAHLAGQVKAGRFVEGRRERVVAELADMRAEPSPGASITTQALRGETMQVYEIEEGWAWGQLEGDGYVGYLPQAALAPLVAPPTHRVSVPSTFLYPGPSMKLPAAMTLPLNAALTIAGQQGDFARVEDEGFVWAAHLAAEGEFERDFVTVAEQFIGVPYLWGGKSSHGIDCSGLVQTAMAGAGMTAPRDTDMQEKSIGMPLPQGEADLALAGNGGLQRGDLIFWRGHVGIMRDADTLLHANGHHMLVACEPLQLALARIKAGSFGAVTSIRRP